MEGLIAGGVGGPGELGHYLLPWLSTSPVPSHDPSPVCTWALRMTLEQQKENTSLRNILLKFDRTVPSLAVLPGESLQPSLSLVLVCSVDGR